MESPKQELTGIVKWLVTILMGLMAYYARGIDNRLERLVVEVQNTNRAVAVIQARIDADTKFTNDRLTKLERQVEKWKQ